MGVIAKFVGPGIALILTLAFGFWVSYLGKPYNGVLFNIHKLVALGAVVVTVIQVAKLLKGAETQALIVVALVVAAVCVVALFASGALMSMGKLDYKLTLTIHQIASALIVVAMVLAGFLLGRMP